jgi:hypothetical protein
MAEWAQQSRYYRFTRMKRHPETTILAIEVRQSRIGYAFFSGPKRLLNWGASTVPARCPDRADWMRRRTVALLRLCSATSIVAKEMRPLKLPNNSTGETILQTILSVIKDHAIPVHLLRRDDVEAAFRVFKVRTKDDIACVLVQIFPELLIRLPPKRKAWQSESHRMIIFDAVANGFTLWQQMAHEDEPRVSPPVPQQLA